jgi:magnesium chelatase subunit D
LAFPFSAFAGASVVQDALLLLAVDPGLNGVLIPKRCGIDTGLLLDGFRSLAGDDAFVELPSSVTEDRLLGDIDLQRTIRAGRVVARRGLLAGAHRRFVGIRSVELLQRHLLMELTRALTSGEVVLEREGLSERYASEFALVAVYDASEDACEPLRDAVAIDLRLTHAVSEEDRLETLYRMEQFARARYSFLDLYAPATALLRARIASAKQRLRNVQMPSAHIARLCQAAQERGVRGHRADLFAVRAARAHAALAGRIETAGEDLAAAIRLVIEPRALQPREGGLQPTRDFSPASEPAPKPQTVPDQAIPTVDCQPPALFTETAKPQHMNPARGRYVRPVAGDSHQGRIALEATIRAAAPFQRVRHGGDGIRLTASDLRFKRFKRPSGVLIVFAVDSSGSMALNRLAHAKGALINLLRQAYVRRDKVALIGFRGDRAELLLAPTRSVHLARGAVDAMKVGGGTPLASGLQLSVEVSRRSSRRGFEETLLVLFTDGRANVGLEHMERACTAVREEGLSTVIVDTNAVPSPDAGRLARQLGARVLRLPGSKAGETGRILARMANTMRSARSEY